MMDTQRYELILSQCESKEEYEQLVREHQDLYVDWRSYLRPLLRERRITYKSIAEGCEVSEASARSFLRKIPAKRENVIMLAMLMRLTVAQTNEMLTRWAKFQKLYARPLEIVDLPLSQRCHLDFPAGKGRQQPSQSPVSQIL